MIRSCFVAVALIRLIASQSYSITAERAERAKVPPIVPAMRELPVRGVIASRTSVPGLSPDEPQKASAVPNANARQN